MTLISAFAIGIPSFVLALEPNRERIWGRFLGNVVVKSIPGAVCSVCCILAANIAGYYLMGLDYEQVSTLCVLLTSWVGCNLVVRLSMPFTAIRAALLVVVVGGTAGACLLMSGVFCIAPFTPGMWLFYGSVAAVSAVAFHVFYLKLDAWHIKRMEKLAQTEKGRRAKSASLFISIPERREGDPGRYRMSWLTASTGRTPKHPSGRTPRAGRWRRPGRPPGRWRPTSSNCPSSCPCRRRRSG